MAIAGGMTPAYKLTLVDGVVKTGDKETRPWELCDKLLDACNKLSAIPPQPAIVAGPEVEMVRQRMKARLEARQGEA